MSNWCLVDLETHRIVFCPEDLGSNRSVVTNGYVAA